MNQARFFPNAAFALLALSAQAPAIAQPDATECRLLHEMLPAAYGRCSTLVVPEDYDDPDGRTLELFVARIPSLTANPAPDPLVLINGGPGGSTVDLYLQLRNAFEPIRRQRDILLLDQRGTGRSLSGLDCELPDDFDLVTSDADEIRARVAACIAEFDFDPRHFTTSVAVRDLEALRKSLAIDQWNIYGVSYGTRVAQHYLRRHGDHVRSMILDGIVPAELALGPDIAGDAQSALDAIFARCADVAVCSERFSDLPAHFDELRQRLAEGSIEAEFDDPISGEPRMLELTETHLQGVVRLMSYNDATVALLPLTLESAWARNYRPLAAQAELQIESVNESIGFAMHNSVVCTEDAPWFPARNETDSQSLYLGSVVIDGLRVICDSWPAGEIDQDFKAPVQSDRPLLLLSGENDPVTPPSNAERIIESGLSNARHIVGSSQGHGIAAVGCVPRLMREFIDAADAAQLDAGCLDDEPPMPFFLSFQGPSP